MTHTHIRSRGATLLGAVFATGTAYVLFGDVINGAPITADHVISGLVLVGTIAAGHLFVPTVKAKRLLHAAGLAVLFAAGTFYCVTSSAGRGAEADGRKQAALAEHNRQRNDVLGELQRARANVAAAETRREAALGTAKRLLDKATADMLAECASGDGKRCRGARAGVEAAERQHKDAGDREVVSSFQARVRELEGKAGQLKPAATENASLKHTAKVLAIFGGTAKDIEGKLELLIPFAKALFLELATITLLGLGLGHKPTLPKQPELPPLPSPANDPAPVTPKRRSRRGATQLDPVMVSFVERYRKKHGRDPSMDDMRRAFPGIARTTAQRYRVLSRAA